MKSAILVAAGIACVMGGTAAAQHDSAPPAALAVSRPSSTEADHRVAPDPAEPDSDGDGLPDFSETHKYFTDPRNADSDGDGRPDGHPDERREYAYSVRAVIRVMPPANEAVLTDDYQDGRVLKRTDQFLELETVTYPLNTVGQAVLGDAEWKRRAAGPGFDACLRPGVTTNWDKAMRGELLAALRADGIDPDRLDDKALVERVSAWALRRASHRNMFCTYFVHFPDGRAASSRGPRPPSGKTRATPPGRSASSSSTNCSAAKCTATGPTARAPRRRCT